MDNNMNNQQMYQQPAYNMGELEKPMSVGDWIIFYIVMCIPVVNLIMLFVWAFGGGSKSRANYCKACLIISAVAIVISVLVTLIITLVFGVSLAGIIGMIESGY